MNLCQYEGFFKYNIRMTQNIPIHIAIIPDGNRRWAKKKGFPSFEGHRVGAEKTLPSLIEKADELGIKFLTFWALSPQNLQREKKEVDNLFRLLRLFLQKRIGEFHKKNIRLRVIGDMFHLPTDLQTEIKKAEKLTEKNSKITVLFAINYGGKNEIIRAIGKIPQSAISNIQEAGIGKFLDTSGIPDPDLIIRTGGEKRLSGFMLWQSEYSELYFSDILFPDFTPLELEKAILDYSCRERRFGK